MMKKIKAIILIVAFVLIGVGYVYAHWPAVDVQITDGNTTPTEIVIGEGFHS